MKLSKNLSSPQPAVNSQEALKTILKNTRTKIEDNDRIKALPRHFGRFHLAFEFNVYGFLSDLCASYNGGYWEFYDLANGGFYMAPSTEKQFLVECRGNYFKGTMSADAAGITACLFALSHLAFDYHEVTDLFAEKYALLRIYAYEHPEADLIMQAID